MKSGVCPKCQGTSILANISLRDEFHNGFDSQVAVNPTPSAFFRVLVNSKIRAWVCEGCGYAEFYVAEPAKLGKAIVVRWLIQRSRMIHARILID